MQSIYIYIYIIRVIITNEELEIHERIIILMTLYV